MNATIFVKRHRFLAVATAALFGYGVIATLPLKSEQAMADTQALPAAVQVTAVNVHQQSFMPWHEYSGSVEAIDQVNVRARVAGMLQSVHFEEGSYVEKGQLLLTIDPAPYRAEEQKAAATVAAAAAQSAQAHLEYQRAKRLWEKKLIAENDMEQLQNTANAAKANLQAAQADLALARLNLSYTQVKAPVSGRIGKLAFTPGNLVAAGNGAAPITSIVSMSPIYVNFDVESSIATDVLAQLGNGREQLMRLNQVPVKAVSNGANSASKGTLKLVNNMVDAGSGTLNMRAVFDNSNGQLLPGQFVRVSLGQAQPSKGVLLTESAIGTDQDKKYVFVVNPQNQVEYRNVTLGSIVAGKRVITSGLNDGDRVIVSGLQRVRPGVTVAVTIAQDNTAATVKEGA
ncbi:efflux RND transporter periplasmic adaptor subunit [Shewanella mangrovi]|uniref:efflux RND transporter periplasmic adaptor subunit n=1 Tax=Shewanella mangrovi TaxID=1515746 RepID=UPI00068EB4B3|nr:efflux RND transporter periplasmic adaptor subunit [Shewanella mangrovi]